MSLSAQWKLSIAIAVAVLLLTMGIFLMRRPAPDPLIVDGVPVGDVIPSDDGRATLTIPEEALPEGTPLSAISIRKIVDGALPIRPSTGSVTGYALEPDGLVFRTPVTFTLTVNAADGTTPQLYHYAPGRGTGSSLEPIFSTRVTIDLGRQETSVSGEIRHFSTIYAVGEEEFFRVVLGMPRSSTVGETFDVRATVYQHLQKERRETWKGTNGTTTRTEKFDRGESWRLAGDFRTDRSLQPTRIEDAPPLQIVSGDQFTAPGKFTCVSVGGATVEYRAFIFAIRETIVTSEKATFRYTDSSPTNLRVKNDITCYAGERSQESARAHVGSSAATMPFLPQTHQATSAATTVQPEGEIGGKPPRAHADRSVPASIPSVEGTGPVRFELDPIQTAQFGYGRGYFGTTYNTKIRYEDLSRPISGGLPTLEQMRAGTHGVGYYGRGKELVERGLITITWTNSNPCGPFTPKRNSEEVDWEHGPPCSGHPEGGHGEKGTDVAVVHPGTITVTVRDNVTGRELRATYDQGSLVQREQP